MLSIARSRCTHFMQLAFLAVTAIGTICSITYRAQVPDLYVGNVHHEIGWSLIWLACLWTVMNLVHRRLRSRNGAALEQQMDHDAMAEYRPLRGAQSVHVSRWSCSSGDGNESSISLPNGWDLNAGDRKAEYGHKDRSDDDDEGDGASEKNGFLKQRVLDRVLSLKIPQLRGRPAEVITALYVMLERGMIPLAFLSLVTGIVTYSGVARGNHIFNVVAHLIKGGIFFCYGILTFGRWMGCFGDLGWAWNLQPGPKVVGQAKARMPSAEWVESCVIFFYGVSNVFLEHLGAWGKEWTAMDFEHVSITIVFFGGGLVSVEWPTII